MYRLSAILSQPEKIMSGVRDSSSEGSWTFLSNYAHVLVYLARDRHARAREIAAAVGITERAVQRIVAELEAAGVLSHTRVGRRNQYEIHRDRPLRHPLESHQTVGQLIDLLTPDDTDAARSAS